MRTLWKGAINFGLINIPVRLITATSKNNIKFRYLHKDCKTPINMKRYCPHCKREVDFNELVRAYEYEDNKFVVLNDEDFDNIPVKSTKTVDIIDFVNLEEIDPIYYVKTYYLGPVEGGEKPYILLMQSMKDNKKVAISRITIRNKESLAVIRSQDNKLVLETMFFADEIRSAEELRMDDLIEKVKITKREEEMASELIDNLTADFEPDKYENQYREELMTIIRKKIEGEEVDIPEIVTPETKVVDLMEKLKASVKATEELNDKEKKKKGKNVG